jgi:hypothetical protein
MLVGANSFFRRLTVAFVAAALSFCVPIVAKARDLASMNGDEINAAWQPKGLAEALYFTFGYLASPRIFGKR